MAQGFLREAQGIHRLEVERVDAQSLLELFAGVFPIILHGVKLTEIVSKLGRCRIVVNSLVELHLGGIESSDQHQVASQDLVSFGVGDV